MVTKTSRLCADISETGYVLIPRILSPEEVSAWIRMIEASLGIAGGGSAGARDVDALWPGCIETVRQTKLPVVIRSILGRPLGVVRALYFDKPPERSWSVGWHKDLTIAVRNASELPEAYRNATVKAGIPHVEAPVQVLSRMIAARIHLDPVGPGNGPLEVLPGSHREGKEPAVEGQGRPIYAETGDVLLMRPLLSHRSGRSRPGSGRHRRILHLEFSPDEALPDGLSWYRFHRVG